MCNCDRKKQNLTIFATKQLEFKQNKDEWREKKKQPYNRHGRCDRSSERMLGNYIA